MPKPKIMTVVGTRPELIKLACLIPKLDENFTHVFVHTGQNFSSSLSSIFFNELEIRFPDYQLNCAAESAMETIANVLIDIDNILEVEKPDAVCIYGDTNSGMSALAVRRRRIPLFHMEAGNRSKSALVPEEVNRKAIDHLASVNFTLSEYARENLLSEGFPSRFIFNFGSHLWEVYKRYSDRIEASKILLTLGLERNQFILASFHREENVDDASNLAIILSALMALSEKYKKRVIFSVHPRTRRRLSKLPDFDQFKSVELHEPFGYLDYSKLFLNARCVISDSGTVGEEGRVLGRVAVMVRNSHERQDAIESGAVLCATLNPESIARAASLIMDDESGSIRSCETRGREVVNYQLSDDLVKVISGYIDICRRELSH